MGLLDYINTLQQTGDQRYSSLSHSELYRMRDRTRDPQEQNAISPYEHRAFAREWMQQNPLVAGVSLPFAIPAYTIYKALGLSNSRSQPSMDEIKQGYVGYGEGLLKALNR